MKYAPLALAGALALAASLASLHAQTDLGQRYAQIGVATYEPIFAMESGTGVAGKFNLPVTKNIDLHLRGARVSSDEDYLRWTDSRVVGGIMFHRQMEGFRPFLSLEAGYEVFDYTISVGGSDYDYSEESAIYNGAVGVEWKLGDTFTVTPLATYEIYYDEPGGDWYVGLEASVKLNTLLSVTATVLNSSSADNALSLSARFRF